MPEPRKVPYARPFIGDEEIAEVVDTLKSGWLTTGPKARRFEEAFAEFIGAPFALAVNSATAGLHLALEAAGVAPGDTVLTTPYTFTATAEVVRYLGADPLFVDVDAATLNMDPALAAAALRRGTRVKAILPVHFAGLACDMAALAGLAEQHGACIIEDAAHALPTTVDGRMVGALGNAAVFSFYANKTITTGEGGMVVTADRSQAERMRTMRLHGISRDVFERYTSTAPSWYYEVVAPGFKYNMPDIAAAIGIHQLRRAWTFQERRQQIAQRYSSAFSGLPLRVPAPAPAQDAHAWHLYVIRLDLPALSIGRDEFIQTLAADGIGTSVHFIPLHVQPYWRDRYRLNPGDFPMAYEAYRSAVSLPIYPTMSDEDVEHVIACVRRSLHDHAR
jgi:dTDP-4-amino-4,6-dideoxygalactose transaminase